MDLCGLCRGAAVTGCAGELRRAAAACGRAGELRRGPAAANRAGAFYCGDTTTRVAVGHAAEVCRAGLWPASRRVVYFAPVHSLGGQISILQH
jgi:hypothetical protein